MWATRACGMSCRLRTTLLLVVLAVLAGCGSTVQSATDTPLTPAPVPTDASTVAPTGTATATSVRNASAAEPRYLRLRPTCERPPGLVIAIQVGALRNNPPGSREGFNTTWQFAAPSNRRTVGSFARFVEVIERGYAPLLEAETVTYDPLVREDDRAVQRVTVRTGNRTAAYRWRLEKQTEGPLEGCWLTVGVTGVEPEAAFAASRPSTNRSRWRYTHSR